MCDPADDGCVWSCPFVFRPVHTTWAGVAVRASNEIVAQPR
jgi:hypothetical protein